MSKETPEPQVEYPDSWREDDAFLAEKLFGWRWVAYYYDEKPEDDDEAGVKLYRTLMPPFFAELAATYELRGCCPWMEAKGNEPIRIPTVEELKAQGVGGKDIASAILPRYHEDMPAFSAVYNALNYLRWMLEARPDREAGETVTYLRYLRERDGSQHGISVRAPNGRAGAAQAAKIAIESGWGNDWPDEPLWKRHTRLMEEDLTDQFGPPGALECPDCNGIGLLIDEDDIESEDEDCETCDGKGWVLPANRR